MSKDDLYIRLKAEGIETLGQLQEKIKQIKTELKGVALNTKEFTDKKNELKNLKGAMKELNGTAGGLHATYFKLGTIIRQATVAFGAITTAAYSFYKVIEMGERTARLEMLRATLEQIARKEGVDFSNTMEEIQKRTNGTVSQFEALQGVMKLTLLDVSWKQIPEIIAFADERAQLLGMSFEAVLAALESAALGGKKAIKQLMIPVDVEQSYKDYARTLGVNKDELSDLGKQHAVFQAILREGAKQHLDINQAAKEQVEVYEKLSTAWDNLGTAAGKFTKYLSPVIEKLTQVMVMWDTFLNTISGGTPTGIGAGSIKGGIAGGAGIGLGGESAAGKESEVDWDKRAQRQMKQFNQTLSYQEKMQKQQDKLREALRKAAEKRGEAGWRRARAGAGTTEDETEWFKAERYLKEFNKGLTLQQQIIVGLADSIDGLASQWTNTIYDLMQGTTNIGQAWKNLGNIVVQEIERMIAKMVAMKIVETLLNIFTLGSFSPISAASGYIYGAPGTGLTGTVTNSFNQASGSSHMKSGNFTLMPKIVVVPIATNQGLAAQVIIGEEQINNRSLKP